MTGEAYLAIVTHGESVIQKRDAAWKRELAARVEPPPSLQLTVRELIARLQTFPMDAKVQTEGCDCYGDACGAELVEGRGGAPSYVLVTR